MTPLRAPLFLIGVGRSGSTVLQRLLGLHPQISWLSGMAERYPQRPGWNRGLLQALEWPLLGATLRRRFRPGECWGFWDRVHPGFRRPFRDLTAEDVTARDHHRFPSALRGMMSPHRPQPMVKLTGWPRIGFLAALFPEARFLHLVRDGRAVAASLCNVSFWRGWQGPSGWRWGPLPPAYEELWTEADRSFPALAGLQWRLLLDAAAKASRTLPPERFLEIRYEDLCREPQETLERALAFVGLSSTSSFSRRLEAVPLRSANEKWQKTLSEAHQTQLEHVLRPPLERYGYLPSQPLPGQTGGAETDDS